MKAPPRHLSKFIPYWYPFCYWRQSDIPGPYYFWFGQLSTLPITLLVFDVSGTPAIVLSLGECLST